MKPFIVVTTRPEHKAMQDECKSLLAQSGLSYDDLQYIALEEVGFLDSFTVIDASGILIGVSPYDADTPAAEKTRSQLNVGEQIHELSGVILKEGIPLLATGAALQVLAAYPGTGTQGESGEEPDAIDLLLATKDHEDPALEGFLQAVTVFVDRYERVEEVPTYATPLAGSPGCPVQMLRVGRNVYTRQFNPELDAVQFGRHVSIYDEAGYSDPNTSEDTLIQARSSEAYDVGQIIRSSISHSSRS